MIVVSAVNFLWLVLQYVLPKRFKRIRDYNFLHCLARKTLQRIQLLLKEAITTIVMTLNKPNLCPGCHQPMTLTLFSQFPEHRRWRTTQ